MTRSTAATHADARADRLLGHRLATPNTGSTTTTATPPPLALYSLKDWQPVKGNAAHGKLQTAVDDALTNCHADIERRQKKIQKEHPLFEASVVTLAQYFVAINWECRRVSERHTLGILFTESSFEFNVVERFKNGALPSRLYLERMCRI